MALDLESVRARITQMATDTSLLEEANVGARREALDLLDMVDEISFVRGQKLGLKLEDMAKALRYRLQEVDRRVVGAVAAYLASPERTPEKTQSLLECFVDREAAGEPDVHVGWDGLDLLMDGVLGVEAQHVEPAPLRHKEMVHYEPTPARVILDLVTEAAPGPEEVFYDLGSGLGQVVILYHLLTDLPARGVEIEPSYLRVARASAQRLGLESVQFIQDDVRCADLSPGTLFFMFTPFVGEMLHQVLARLREVAAHHPIRLCSYGSCTLEAAKEPWLKLTDPSRRHAFKLAIFESTQEGQETGP